MSFISCPAYALRQVSARNLDRSDFNHAWGTALSREEGRAFLNETGVAPALFNQILPYVPRAYSTFFFDYDDTLSKVRSQRQSHPLIFKQLTRLLELGANIVFISGRTYREMDQCVLEYLFAQEGFKDVYKEQILIYANAATYGYTATEGSGKPFFKKEFKPKDREQLEQMIKEKGWGTSESAYEVDDAQTMIGVRKKNTDEHTSAAAKAIADEINAWLKDFPSAEVDVTSGSATAMMVPKGVTKEVALNDAKRRLILKKGTYAKIGDQGARGKNDFGLLSGMDSYTVDSGDAENKDQVQVPEIISLRKMDATSVLLAAMIWRIEMAREEAERNEEEKAVRPSRIFVDPANEWDEDQKRWKIIYRIQFQKLKFYVQGPEDLAGKLQALGYEDVSFVNTVNFESAEAIRQALVEHLPLQLNIVQLRPVTVLDSVYDSTRADAMLHTLDSPAGLVALKNGRLFVANWGYHYVRPFEYGGYYLEPGPVFPANYYESFRSGKMPFQHPWAMLDFAEDLIFVSNLGDYSAIVALRKNSSGEWDVGEITHPEKDKSGVFTLSSPRAFLKMSDTELIVANMGNNTLRIFKAAPDGRLIPGDVIISEPDRVDSGLLTVDFPGGLLKLSDTSFMLANRNHLRIFDKIRGKWISTQVILPEKDPDGIETISEPKAIRQLNETTFILANTEEHSTEEKNSDWASPRKSNLRVFRLIRGTWTPMEVIRAEDADSSGRPSKRVRFEAWPREWPSVFVTSAGKKWTLSETAGLAFFPDGRLVVSNRGNNTLALFDVQSSLPVAPRSESRQEVLLELVRSKVEQVARSAGEIMLDYKRQSRQKVEIKGDGSELTPADQAIQELLDQELPEIIPGSIVIGEESFNQQIIQKAKDADYVWIVDPIDGTKPFSKGEPGYVTAILLLHQGEPVLGLIYAPEYDLDGSGASMLVTYAGQQNVFLNQNPVTLKTETAALANSKVSLYASSKVQPPDYYRVVREKAREVVANPGGSGFINVLRMVTSLTYPGQDHELLYMKPTPSVWDIVQGAFMVTQAGGLAVYDNGTPVFPLNMNLFDFSETGSPRLPSVVLGNPSLVQEVVNISSRFEVRRGLQFLPLLEVVLPQLVLPALSESERFAVLKVFTSTNVEAVILEEAFVKAGGLAFVHTIFTGPVTVLSTDLKVISMVKTFNLQFPENPVQIAGSAATARQQVIQTSGKKNTVPVALLTEDSSFEVRAALIRELGKESLVKTLDPFQFQQMTQTAGVTDLVRSLAEAFQSLSASA